MRRLASSALCAVLAALAMTAPARGQQPASLLPTPSLISGISFDMAVVDREGRVPDGLGPGDISVSVDGKARRVLAVRRISRGPGAVIDAAARQARATGSTTFAAEPVRNILVVVDQAGLVRGEERAVVSASQALLGRLGMADRLAVVLLPFPSGQQLSLTTEQPVARELLARTAGQINPAFMAKADVPALPPLSNAASTDPDRAPPPDPVPMDSVAPAMREAEPFRASGTLSGLADLLDAIRSVPGRKVVALFSAGLADSSLSQFTDLAVSAIAARAAIAVFAMPGPRDDGSVGLQVAPLETLARSTGGVFVSPGRNPERAISRAVSELAACFVVELEPAGTDADGKRHTLRVEVAGRGLTVRAPAWLMPAADAGDLPAEGPATGTGTGVEPARNEAGSRTARAPEAPSGREVELQLAMGRLVDYVEAYERQYSGLVAEEEYVQSSRGRNVRLRSDYLLVKPEKSSAWVSFRDVYEVDGAIVRDRDDRLRQLFLDPGIDIGAQLQAISTESARYNIGAVERNINVPLFLLRFLSTENRPRFRFRLMGKRQMAGNETWRIEFDERVKPTIITDLQGRDVEAKGWFLVDEMTGAIVQTGLKVEEAGSTGEIVVSFRHDEALGMWVPSRMTETYRTMTQRSLSGVPRLEPFVEGTAAYSKFRRFQVKTEEKVVIPK
jgi:hypothetical protein